MALTEMKSKLQETKDSEVRERLSLCQDKVATKSLMRKSQFPKKPQYTKKSGKVDNQLSVMSAQKGKDLDFGSKTFLLSFPVGSLWRLSKSPFAKLLESETLEWLKKSGLLSKDRK